MLVISLATMHFFGLTGFIVTWLIWEIVQTRFVLGLNAKLFPKELGITSQAMVRLSIFMTLAFALSLWPAFHDAAWSLVAVVGFALAFSAGLAVAAYYVFGLGELREILAVRLRNRFALRATQ